MKYQIYAKVVATKYIGIIEAESEEEAIEMADNHDEAYVILCHQCASQANDAEIVEFLADPVAK